MTDLNMQTNITGLEIAVIGMNCRFPGAKNLDEYWEILKNGVESVTFFTDTELSEIGIDKKQLNNPDFIKVASLLEDIEYFDCSFFGYTPIEAEIMDPQLRIFHECVWEVLEIAGYDPFTYDRLIGLYAGACANFYWEARVELSGKSTVLGWFPSRQLNDKDFIATRIAHRLNLKGPAVVLDTACSTTLVAIHLACQGLLSGDCDIALAGGVNIPLVNTSGYTYQEGMLHSPDGHCRVFDTKAKGTTFGCGVGVVVLKRLEEAIEDRDCIDAVIKGTYINNDGSSKPGYTAPSIAGQAAVVRTALKMAEVEPESITYVETHGTGTVLGDPAEIEGLKLAFNTPKKQFCRIGSVKSNFGHLEIAAGAAGFIKTVLALKHRLIPPSLHFETPNPKIDFENSPFYVNTTLIEWKNDKYPLRAGVSSFGIGGTNAHVVLEEAPHQTTGLAPLSDGHPSPGYQLILLSARTETALNHMTQNLVNHFQKYPDINLADTAYTLQIGRKTFKYRRMLVCQGVNEAIDALSSLDPGKVKTAYLKEENRPVVFMFSGLGSQYVNMGRDLYERITLFREAMDRCFDILNRLLDYDIKEILYPGISVSKVRKVSEVSGESPGNSPLERGGAQRRGVSIDINQTEITQVIIFIFEYALAELLIHWGIKPAALIGYSFGEYMAACVSGVFSLEDALNMVILRSQLIKETPVGAMLSVPLPKEKLEPFLTDFPLSLSVDNGPSCIVSGPTTEIEAFDEKMKENRYVCVRLPHAARAFHSHMMTPILDRFRENLRRFNLKEPQIPYIANVTGQWADPRQVTQPDYWAVHLSQTVQFAEGMKTLLKKPGAIFIEIGPGRDISTLASRLSESDGNGQYQVLNLVRAPHQDISDVHFLANRISRLWLCGQSIDWNTFHGEEWNQRNRISLPTYPFQRQSYWIQHEAVSRGMKIMETSLTIGKKEIDDWFYIPSWKRLQLPATPTGEITTSACWLVFLDGGGLGLQLVKQLEKEAKTVVTVKTGEGFLKESEKSFFINPQKDSDFHMLFSELHQLDAIPEQIVHLWGVTQQRNPSKPGNETPAKIDMERAINAQSLGFFSLLTIAQAIGELGIKSSVQLTVVTNNMQEVTGKDGLYPEKATVMGPVKVIPTEYTNIKCRSIDVVLPSFPSVSWDYREEKLVKQLRDELISTATEPVVAYRGDYRWVQTYEPRLFQDPGQTHLPLKQSGVYLVTGGLGGIGLVLAEYLAKEVRAKLLLTSRSELPPPDQWEQCLAVPNNDEKLKEKIQKIKELEKAGAQVMVLNADVSHKEQMQKVIAWAEEQLGPINGIIHCAGLPDGEIIQRRTRETSMRIIKPKLEGTLVFDHLLHLMREKPDFFILCSSVVSMVPTFGQAGYCAANAFLDAFAHYRNITGNETNHTLTVSINWDRWRSIGIANIMETRHKELTGQEMEGGFTRQQGVELFRRILLDPQPQVAISTRDLGARIQQSRAVNTFSLMEGLESDFAAETLLPRPNLVSEYIAPTNETEQSIAEMWATFLGFSQVGIKDDFFELGGDSLKALILLPKIQKELNVQIPITDFFRRPTIQKLAEYIDGMEKDRYYSIAPVEKKDYYALSSAQKGLYALQMTAPASTAYNEFTIMVFEGDVEIERLNNNFKTLIHRHESFRSSFTMLGENPVQRIHDEVEFQIEHYDLTTGDKGQGIEGRTDAHLLSVFIHPFDLACAPLLRVGLQQIDANRRILLIDLHHLIADGRSLDIFIDELLRLYEGKELPPLAIQYKEFSAWQDQFYRDKKEKLNRQKEYWVNKFADKIPVLDLPFDYPRPQVQTFEGKSMVFQLDRAETKALKELALKEAVTLFMVLQGVYTVLLSRLSGQEDIVIGSPIVGRNRTDLHSIIGMFVNMLVFRNFPSSQKTFPQFLKELKETTIEALENQDYPFEELVEQLGIRRDAGRNSLFNVTFAMLDTRIPRASREQESKPTGIKKVASQHRMSKFDLGLEVLGDIDDKLSLSFLYSTKLFKKDTIKRYSDYLKQIISIILKDKNIRLKDISIGYDLVEPETIVPQVNFNF